MTTMTTSMASPCHSDADIRPRAGHHDPTATTTTTTRIVGGGHGSSSSIETYFPHSRISNVLGTMIAATVGNDRYLLLTLNDNPDASFVGIVGSMGRMERDDANDDDDAASYVYESRNVDAVVGGGGRGMRRNAPGGREERTGGDGEEKGQEVLEPKMAGT
jgi:hypothetical protein